MEPESGYRPGDDVRVETVDELVRRRRLEAIRQISTERRQPQFTVASTYEQYFKAESFNVTPRDICSDREDGGS